MRLQVDAAGIEADPLSDERDPREPATARRRPIGQARDARAAMRVGLGDCEERAGAQPLERRDVVKLERPALALRESLR